MKRSVVFLVLGILLVLFQASFLSLLLPFAPRPNFILVVLVYLSIKEEGGWVPLWAACVGLFFDTLSGGPFGLFFFIFVALYIIIKGISKALLLRHPAFQVGVVLLAHLLQGALLITILTLLGLPFPGEPSQAIPFSICSLFGALISLPFFVLLEKIDHPAGLPRLV